MGTLIDENTTNQCGKILEFMKTRGSITAAQAVMEFRCFRLAARIADLEARGHNIRHERVSDKNTEGRTVTFARYSLIEEETA